MDWLILIVGIPAILIPLVLLFGFAGCATPATPCFDDSDCPGGSLCGEDGQCVLPPAPDDTVVRLSPPDHLTAIALDDHSVFLTWHNTDPAATGFQIERAEEGDEPQRITPSGTISPDGTTDDSRGLQEGITFVYQVKALVDGAPPSDASETSSATVLPATPANFAATPQGFGINLTWTNASTVTTQFSLERRVTGGTFTEVVPGPGEIVPGPGNSYTFFDTGSDIGGLSGGTTYEYHVSAVVNGFENNARKLVKSAAAVASATTLPFTTAFTATLTTDQSGNEGVCLVQRLSPALLAGAGTQVRNQVGFVLRGSTTGDLTLDSIFISRPDPTLGADPYDPDTDLTFVASNVTIAQNTTVTVGPVNYALDPTKPLLVAFDISNTQGNLRFTTLAGADQFGQVATAEAGQPNRTSGYIGPVQNTLFLIEKIEVL